MDKSAEKSRADQQEARTRAIELPGLLFHPPCRSKICRFQDFRVDESALLLGATEFGRQSQGPGRQYSVIPEAPWTICHFAHLG
jgi:hypothetical protein